MSSKDEAYSASKPLSGKQLRIEDLLQCSNIFSSEFNNSSLHDRVLVFQVRDECACGDEGGLNSSTNQNEVSSSIKYSQKKNLPLSNVEDKVNHFISKELSESAEEGLLSKANNREKGGVFIGKCKVSQKPLQESDCDDYSNTDDEDKENRKVKGKHSDRKSKGETISAYAEKVVEHKLFVHSCWLAVQSSYFRALFFCGMQETHSKEIVMQVTEDELTAHLTLIEAMYQPDILDDKDYSLVLEVLILANKYDVSLVFKKCKYVLMATPMSLDICESILEIVNDLLATKDVLGFLENFLIDEFKPLEKTWRLKKFQSLSVAALRLLISSHRLVVISENTVFVAIMHWLENNEYVGPSLLPLVRPELMTVDFLHDVVQPHNVAKKLDGFNQLLLSGFSYHSLSTPRKKMLETKPVKRSEYNNKEPAFTWVVTVDGNISLPDFPKTYQSEHFWCYGYEMMLSLSFESNSCSIYLYVLNLIENGYLNMSWHIKADSFLGTSLKFSKVFNDSFGWGCDKIKCRFSPSVNEGRTHVIKFWVDLFA